MADCEACSEHVGRVVSVGKGLPYVLVLTVGIRVSSWGAVSLLSHRGVGTRKLGLRGAFCYPSIIKCQLFSDT